MPIKSYYLVLGVSPEESSSGIRSAFRELAKRYHPDHGGPGSEERFREITEAYDVLSDPRRRRLYDLSLREPDARADTAAEDLRSRPTRSVAWPEAEPLRGRPSPRDFASFAAEMSEPLDLEVVLSPEEARSGAVVSVPLPVLLKCPYCGGSTRRSWVSCIACAGRGLFVTEERFQIELPPHLATGATLDVPLARWGVTYGRLRMHVEIASA